MFKIGQKVEYIGMLPVDRMMIYAGPIPKRRTPYTVSNSYMSDNWSMIELIELPTPEDSLFCPGFNARDFVPIVERRTDISVFKKLLNPTPQERRELIGHDLGFTREEIGVE